VQEKARIEIGEAKERAERARQVQEATRQRVQATEDRKRETQEAAQQRARQVNLRPSPIAKDLRPATVTAGYGRQFGSNIATKPSDNEIEFVIQDALSYANGQSVRSRRRTVGSMQFRLLVFPTGTLAMKGLKVSAFVEPCVENLPRNWEYKSVNYRIQVLNWKNLSQSIVKVDKFSFNAEGHDRGLHDRGWHDLVSTRELRDPAAGWCRPDRSICIRATVTSIPVLTQKV